MITKKGKLRGKPKWPLLLFFSFAVIAVLQLISSRRQLLPVNEYANTDARAEIFNSSARNANLRENPSREKLLESRMDYLAINKSHEGKSFTDATDASHWTSTKSNHTSIDNVTHFKTTSFSAGITDTGTADSHALNNNQVEHIITNENKPFFLKNEAKNCFIFEDLCLARQDGSQWFYFTDDTRDNSYRARQPAVFLNITYDPYFWGYGGIGIVDYSVQFNVSSTLPKTTLTELKVSSNCSLSRVSNHVVVQSAYNGMIGEFYARSLLPLSQLMEGDVQDESDIQFYIHLLEENAKLYDAHKLLMNGMSHGPEVKAWSDMFSPRRNSCDCYRRLVLCGYRHYGTEDVASSSSGDPTASPPLVNKTSSLPMSQSQTLKKMLLHPAGDVTANITCAKNMRPENLIEGGCPLYSRLRQSITKNLQKRHPSLSRDVAAYRIKIIYDTMKSIALGHVRSRRLQDKMRVIRHHDWKIIGLAQRTSRRSWLNLDETLSYCNEHFHYFKVLCIEVNVEKSIFANNATDNIFGRQIQSKEEQLIIHRSLDALIGIHGAQLTQGILLPSQSFIVELLPWIPHPNYWGRAVWGDWTQYRHIPTPLGVIYHNVDLNHLGYSLGRDSVPLCENATNDLIFLNPENDQGEKNETELEYCLMTAHGDSFRWDYRNFNVKIDMIDNFVGTFFRVGKNHSATTKHDNGTAHFCEKILQQRENTSFVLYNIWCPENDGSLNVHHLYES